VQKVYPKSVFQLLKRTADASFHANAVGRYAALECGTFVEFRLLIDSESKLIQHVSFRSNGCGFMVAAANLITDHFRGRHLTDLHALAELPTGTLSEQSDAFPDDRLHCSKVVMTALRNTFASFRQSQVEEFSGEKALICTCFGITEEVVESTIKLNSAATVEEVGVLCGAGTGCGSCQMMIQEIIDSISVDR